LIPDKNVKYFDKKNLKKQKVLNYRIGIYATTIAASVLMILIFRHYELKTAEKSTIPELTNAVNINKNNKGINAAENTNEVVYSSVLNKKNSTAKPIAVFDTNNPHIQDKVRLAAIDSRKIIFSNSQLNEGLLTNKNGILMKEPEVSQNNGFSTTKKPLIADHHNRERLILRALKLGVKGIGNMTETNLAINTEHDESGNLAAIAFSAGGFEISRKISSNSQKN
jgi:hypothetical protein